MKFVVHFDPKTRVMISVGGVPDDYTSDDAHAFIDMEQWQSLQEIDPVPHKIIVQHNPETNTVFFQKELIEQKFAFSQSANRKIRHLVPYKLLEDAPRDAVDCIVAVHDLTAETLTLTVYGEIATQNTTHVQSMLFFVPKRDATIIIKSFRFDLDELKKNKSMVVSVPDMNDYYLAGFPLMEKMYFLKQK